MWEMSELRCEKVRPQSAIREVDFPPAVTNFVKGLHKAVCSFFLLPSSQKWSQKRNTHHMEKPEKKTRASVLLHRQPGTSLIRPTGRGIEGKMNGRVDGGAASSGNKMKGARKH